MTPQWGLSLVSQYLNGNPFEPITQTSFLDLICKMVFLLVHASGTHTFRDSECSPLYPRPVVRDWLMVRTSKPRTRPRTIPHLCL